MCVLEKYLLLKENHFSTLRIIYFKKKKNHHPMQNHHTYQKYQVCL